MNWNNAYTVKEVAKIAYDLDKKPREKYPENYENANILELALRDEIQYIHSNNNNKSCLKIHTKHTTQKIDQNSLAGLTYKALGQTNPDEGRLIYDKTTLTGESLYKWFIEKNEKNIALKFQPKNIKRSENDKPVSTKGHNAYRAVIRVMGEAILGRPLTGIPATDAKEIIKAINSKKDGTLFPFTEKTLESYLKDK